jgi:hypothetical protein
VKPSFVEASISDSDHGSSFSISDCTQWREKIELGEIRFTFVRCIGFGDRAEQLV